MPEISRGDIWWVNWSPGRSSEQTGRRPALVVQTNAANHNPNYPNTIVVAVSTKGREVPFHVRLEPSEENGLSMLSFAKCEQVLTISKDRLEQRLGRVGEHELEQVDSALRMVLNL
jgi:mRNA interferase MazF